ncbi:MAG TPA: copper oxidase [Isosphaeraceae bacterium]|jgi:FtsP/CotA-like multicopper oxidase with cupredoxin domain|nr:copper oxidase [Isosphaeraceae bacterium]
MDQEPNRRAFLRGGALTTAGALVGGAAQAGEDASRPSSAALPDYPRERPAVWGPVGSPTDRGKLVPGYRDPGGPPVPVVTPDVPYLGSRLNNGVKEFHLIAEPVKREFLPNLTMDVWGFNGTMPGPTIEVTQGDRVRVIVENRLPEPTSIHWHGFEIAVSLDGVPGLVQDFIPPGEAFVYEFDITQVGTMFYHAHVAMHEAMGMVGLFIMHPKVAHDPPVDQDFGLITQEFAILPNQTIPNSQGMDFNFLTFNGHCAPLTTPLIVKLGNRVRLRFVNFSTADHHPIHLHGHTWWVTGTEGGRIPESGWLPGNNVLVGVAQARDVEFIANNPGDWIMHCHMFHHTMNHMVPKAGPMTRVALTDPRSQVPGYPQGMEGGMAMMKIPEDDRRPLQKREARGMRHDWSLIKGLTTIVRVLPPDLYDQVMLGNEPLEPGASIFGPKPGRWKRS